MLPEFFTLRNWARFCLCLSNQCSYGQMDGSGGFSASNWSKIYPPRCSDCRLLMLYGRENLWIGLDQNTLPPMAPVFLHISSKLLREILEQLCVYCRNLQEFARFMCQEVWEQRCSGCGGSNSDR